MAANVYTPSLSEITSIKGDADLGNAASGNSNAVLPLNEGMQYLAAAAKQKADNDMMRYIQFQKNLENNMKGFEALDTSKMMEKDYDTIMPQYVDVAKDLAENWDILRNPAKNLTKFKELQGKESALRQAIAKSKLQRQVLEEHEKFTQMHPEFLTDENRAMIEAYQNETDPSKRQVFTLNTPYVYDPSNAIKEATAASEQLMSNTIAEKGTGYFLTTEGKKYLHDEYNKAFRAALQRQNKINAGKTDLNVLERQFNSAGGQKALGMDFETWLDNHINSTIPQDYFATKYSVDPRQQFDANEANDMKRHKDEMAYKWAALRQAKELAKDRLEKNQEELGDFLNDTVASLYYDKTPVQPADVVIGGKNIKGGWVQNVSPATLEMLGKTRTETIMNADGKTVKNIKEIDQPADAVFRTEDNKLMPVYYARDAKGNIKLGKSGAIIFETGTSKPLTPDELKQNVAKKSGGKEWQVIYSQASKNLKHLTGSASLEGDGGQKWIEARKLRKGEGVNAPKPATTTDNKNVIFDWNKKK